VEEQKRENYCKRCKVDKNFILICFFFDCEIFTLLEVILVLEGRFAFNIQEKRE
jgi:hypothetical protein